MVNLHIFSKAFKSKIKELGKRTIVITDSNVAPLYGERLATHLECDLIDFPAGEENKTRTMKTVLEDALFEKGYGRDSCIIGLGGGVVTDLVGFLAATYCRGVPFISIPTTLLGMCDAAIGGKTGVNLASAKNFIGAFQEPHELIIDTSLLESLDERLLKEGMAEVIKHGAILDAELFQALKNFQGYKPDFLKMVTQKSYEIKTSVVTNDVFECGQRRVLNFGHTIAHALETLEGYEISHGEAVALGCITEAKLSNLEKPLIEMFKLYEFPLKVSSRITTNAMLEVMKMDKKAREGTPRFVRLKAIGEVESFNGAYCKDVPLDKLKETLDWMITCHAPK